MKIKIVGPFITNFSYARVNRGLAKALSELPGQHEVSVFQFKEKIDKWPDSADLEEFPYLKNLWVKENLPADVAIVFDYPKEGIVPLGLKDLKSKQVYLLVAWEETVYPQIWVDEVNAFATGVFAASSFVKNILEKNGVKVPIFVVHCSVDDDIRNFTNGEYSLKTNKNIKFLHVSTGRMRKGADALINAYRSKFSSTDDVCLVIKTSNNPDNLFFDLIKDWKSTDPEVEIITENISDQQLAALTKSCDVAVYPSRAEGYGLIIAEAMVLGTPVIATNYSAYLDFANHQNSWLIDYELADAVSSEMALAGSKWAEPDSTHLAKTMRELYDDIHSHRKNSESPYPEKIQQRIDLAHKETKDLNWTDSAKIVLKILEETKNLHRLKDVNMAVVSFLNSQDGIGEYTKHLFSNIEKLFKNFYYFANTDIADRVAEDEENVLRVWETGEKDFKTLLTKVKELEIEIIHIQYHSGTYYPLESLSFLIKSLHDLGVKVFVTPHSVTSENFDVIKDVEELKLAEKVFIHNPQDVELAKKQLSNVEFFPLPKLIYPKRDRYFVRRKLRLESSLIVASHGYMNSQKTKLAEVIYAVASLKETYPDVLYLAINAVSANNISSQTEFEACKKLVKKLGLEKNITFVTDFLPEETVHLLLQAADFNILPYVEVGESASAAINKCLASGSVTIVPDIKMFAEFTNQVYKIPGTNSQDIANSILNLLKNPREYSEIIKNAEAYVRANSYLNASVRLVKAF